MIDERTLLDGKELARLARENKVPVEKFVADLGTLYRSRGYEQDQSGEWNLTKPQVPTPAPDLATPAQAQVISPIAGAVAGTQVAPQAPTIATGIYDWAKRQKEAMTRAMEPREGTPPIVAGLAPFLGPIGQMAISKTPITAAQEAVGMVKSLGEGPFGVALNPLLMPIVKRAVEGGGPAGVGEVAKESAISGLKGLVRPFIAPGESFEGAPLGTAMAMAMLGGARAPIRGLAKLGKKGGLRALGGVTKETARAMADPKGALESDLATQWADIRGGRKPTTIAGVDAAGAGSANALYNHPELLKTAIDTWGLPEGTSPNIPIKDLARAVTTAMLEHQYRALESAFQGTKTKVIKAGTAADEYIVVSDLPASEVSARIEIAKSRIPTLEIPSIKKGAETVVAGQVTHRIVNAADFENPKSAIDVALNVEKRQQARGATPTQVSAKPVAEPVRITTEPPISGAESDVPVLSTPSRATVRNVPGMGRVVRLQAGQPILSPLTTPAEALPGRMLASGIPERVGGELVFPEATIPRVETPQGLVGGRTIELAREPLTPSEMVNAAIERKLAGERSALSQMTRGGMERRSIEPVAQPPSPQLRPGRIQSRMLGREAVIIGGRPVVGANIGDIGNAIIQSPELLAEAKNIVKSGGKLETGFVNAEGKFTSSPWEPHTANNLETIVALAKERGVSTLPAPGAEALPGKPPALPKPSAEPVAPPVAPVGAKEIIASKPIEELPIDIGAKVQEGLLGGEAGSALNPAEAIRRVQNATYNVGEAGPWGRAVEGTLTAARKGFSKLIDPVKHPIFYRWFDAHRGLGFTGMIEKFREAKLAEEFDPVFGKELGVKHAEAILDVPEQWHPLISKALQDIASPLELKNAPPEVMKLIEATRKDFSDIWNLRKTVKAGEYGKKVLDKTEQLGIEGAGKEVRSLIEAKNWDVLEKEWGLDSPSRAHSFSEMAEGGLRGYGGKRTYEFWRVKPGSKEATLVLDEWSNNPKLTAPKGIKYPEKIINDAGKQVQEWVTLPKDKRLGALSGRQVKSFLVDKIDQISEPGLQTFLGKKTRLTKEYHRTDIPEAYREDVLLQTKNPVVPILQAMTETAHNIAYGKLFNELAYKPEFSKWVVDSRQAGYRLLPENPQLGPISGKWVHPGLHDYLMKVQKTAPGTFEYYLKALNAWRWMKTVGSLPTQARNVASNFILADMAGLSPWRMDVWYRGMRDFSTHSEMFREATTHGALEGRFLGEYIKPLISEGESLIQSGKIKNIMELVTKIPEGSYQGAEQIAKMSVYRYLRTELKYAPEKAADLARNAIFDYGEIPFFIEAIRNVPVIGRPFAIFPFKAMPRIAKQAIKHPIRFGKYPVGLLAIEEIARRKLGYSKEDWESMKSINPTYMQSGKLSKWIAPNYIPLPMRDKDGNIQWLNTAYILPWGQTEQYIGGQPSYYAEEARRGARILPPALVSQEPLFNLAADIQSNLNWQGRPIVEPGMNLGDRVSAVGKHVAKQLGPTTIPPLDIAGGLLEKAIPGIEKFLPYGAIGEKIARTVSGRPDYRGKVLTPQQALGETVGVKVVPTNEIEELRRVLIQYRSAYNKIDDEIRQVQYRHTMPVEDKKERIANLQKNKQRLVDEYKGRIGNNPYLQTVIEQLKTQPQTVPTTK